MRNEQVTAGFTSDELDLYEALRETRKILADSEGLAAFYVCSNKAIADMCRILPTNSAEMLQVNGIGEAKNEKYGEVFISAITSFLSEHPIFESSNLTADKEQVALTRFLESLPEVEEGVVPPMVNKDEPVLCLTATDLESLEAAIAILTRIYQRSSPFPR